MGTPASDNGSAAEAQAKNAGAMRKAFIFAQVADCNPYI
jgi:hypothetical protein